MLQKSNQELALNCSVGSTEQEEGSKLILKKEAKCKIQAERLEFLKKQFDTQINQNFQTQFDLKMSYQEEKEKIEHKLQETKKIIHKRKKTYQSLKDLAQTIITQRREFETYFYSDVYQNLQNMDKEKIRDFRQLIRDHKYFGLNGKLRKPSQTLEPSCKSSLTLNVNMQETNFQHLELNKKKKVLADMIHRISTRKPTQIF